MSPSVIADPADVFCELFDELDDRAVESDRRWEANDHLGALTTEVKAYALDLELDRTWLSGRISEVARRAGEDAARWAAARGIDRALASSNPSTSAPAGRADRPLKQLVDARYAELGRFDTGAVRGALLPKLSGAGRGGETTVSRAQAFASVHRVPPDIWESKDVDFGRIRAKRAPLVRAIRNGRQGLVVACVPLVESLDEVNLQPFEEDGRRLFTSGLLATAGFEERIRTVLRRLDDSGAMLGMAPELALSEEVLDAWKRALSEERRPHGSALQWVFVGSGPLGDATPQCNCAVVLDRETGLEVHSQEKLYPFTLKPEQCSEWGLGAVFSTQVEEAMTRGEQLRIRETDWGRVAVLICEDLAKVLEDKVGRMVRGFGASLLLTPVFSKEVLAHHWEHSQAKVYADQVGASTVVANSLVIPRATGERHEVGTCLVNANGSFEIGKSMHPDQISVFWMTTEGVDVPATHPVATRAPWS